MGMALSRKRRLRAPRRWSEKLSDLYDYSASASPRRSPSPRPREPIRVTDDWPERVPIGDTELRVLEGHLREELDALFGALP